MQHSRIVQISKLTFLTCCLNDPLTQFLGTMTGIFLLAFAINTLYI